MKIKDLGEKKLIERISRKCKSKNVKVGIGDDAALVDINGKDMVFTTDSLVEGKHFKLDWFLPGQIGKKAIEINVSDIGAMNSKPLYCLVSLCLPKDTDVKFLDKLYEGIYSVCDKYKIDVIGGNMTNGKQIIVDVTMIGESIGNVPLRKNAKPGDKIIVTGNLGNSAAGLNLFFKGKKGFSKIKKKYLERKAKLEKAHKLSKLVNSMEDCSDGLSSEVRNICDASDCGAIIDWDKIPFSKETKKACREIRKDPHKFALFGGEDFELVATISKDNLSKINAIAVGKITKEKGIFLKRSGKKEKLEEFGYDHFR